MYFFKGVLNAILHASVLCSLVPLWVRAECKKAPVLIQHPRRIKNLSICLHCTCKQVINNKEKKKKKKKVKKQAVET